MSIYKSTKVLPYVYKLTHKETGKFYYGYQEANRVPSSESLGKIYFTGSKYVAALNFSAETAHNFDILIIAEFFKGDDAWEFEQRIIEENIKNPLCLNRIFVKAGKLKFSTAGVPHTAEARAKISKAQTGRPLSPKARATADKRRGVPLSPEILARRAGCQLGRKLSEEHIKKLTGLKRTAETCAKISAARLGTKLSDEHKMNISKSLKGKKQKPGHGVGTKNSAVKIWTILTESGEIFEVSPLNSWLNERNMSVGIFQRTCQTDKFYNGYRLLGSRKP